MKILVLSDIHANWYALEAILDKESYDALIFLGDVVDFGPNPKKCVRFLMDSSRNRFWGVRGDHDHALASGIGEFETENKVGGINTDFILIGHSHKPFIKHLGRVTVLNPGSVGQPRDFNPRASYAVIEDGNATINRVRYDIEKTVRDLEKSSLPKEVIRELVSILVIGGLVKDEIYYC